ncbi:MAG: glycosyltransferase family 2 protein [Actinomycetota bacterium]
MPDVILPVLNEADALPGILARVPAGWCPIVVDNGSDDGSGDIARRLGVEVVVERQCGFGAACFRGLVAARAEIVCFMDCDGSLDPADLVRVAKPVKDGIAGLSLGARRAEKGAWPIHAKVANRLLARYVRRRTGVALEDIGPMRAARRVELMALNITDRRFGWPLEMVMRAHRAGWRIVEVPVPYHARSGTSKVTGTLGGTVRTVRDMARAAR